jgi:anti-anti-sigma factor
MDITPLGDRLVKVVLDGRLDTPGVDRVETRFIASLVPNGNSAIVDMSQINFVSSMGIRMLVSAARSLKTRGAKLALYDVQPQVNQVFDTVSLGQIISICDTEADALAAVGATSGHQLLRFPGTMAGFERAAADLRSLLDDHALDGQYRHNIELAFEEIAVNIVRHGSTTEDVRASVDLDSNATTMILNCRIRSMRPQWVGWV